MHSSLRISIPAWLRVLPGLFFLFLLTVTLPRQAVAKAATLPALAPGNASGWQQGSVFPLSGDWGFAWQRWLSPDAPDTWGSLQRRPMPGVLRFFCALFPGDGQRWLLRLGDVVGLGFAFTTLIAPVYRFADWAKLFQAAGVFVCLLILAQLPSMIRKRRPGAPLFAFSLVLLFAAVLNDLLMAHFVIHSRLMLPLGSIAFVGCQARLASLRRWRYR